MTLKDWTQSLWDKVKAGSLGREDDMQFNLSKGGFSGYHPNTAKNRMGMTQKQQPAPQEAPSMPMGMEQQPDLGQQPTGFTGMVQPQQGMDYQQTGYQQAAYQAQQTGYQQPAPYQQATGYQPQVNQGYDMGYQPQQMGQTGGYQQPQQNWPEAQPAGDYGMGQMNQPYQPQGMNSPYGYQQPMEQPAYQEPQAYQPQEAPAQNNISYMPGNFVGDDGRAYSHVERIAMVSNVATCYRIIEFMRNNESVIINTESITDEAENQRCLDVLYGAAFAMQCSFTRIAAKSIYLVAPGTVMVVPYDAIRRMSDQDVNTRWPETERDNRFDRSYREERRSSYTQRQSPYAQPYSHQEGYTSSFGYKAVGYR